MASTLHLLAPHLPTGTAKQIRYLTEHLRSPLQPHQVCSFDVAGGNRRRLAELLPGVTFSRSAGFLDAAFVLRLARLIRVSQADRLHCWGGHRARLIRFANRLAGGKRIVWSVRSQDELQQLRHIEVGEQVITNAVHLQEGAARRYDQVSFIRNAVEAPAWSVAPSPLWRELRVDPASRFIGCITDLRRGKRLKEIIWAYDLLHVIRPDVHLILVGTGSQQAELMAFAKNMASARAIHFLDFRWDTTSVWRQCACAWQMSDREGCSNGVLEALAAGVPVVAADIPGNRELFDDGAWGDLVTPGDCAEMARKTNLLLDVKTPSRTANARDHVLRRYAMDAMVDEFRGLNGDDVSSSNGDIVPLGTVSGR